MVISDIEAMYGVAHLLFNHQAEAQQIIDARPSEIFYDNKISPPNGHEPRIRYSKNLPADLLLDDNGLLKSERELSRICLENDVDTI